MARRDSLFAVAALVAGAPLLVNNARPDPSTSLRSAAQAAQRSFGAAVQMAQLRADPAFRAAVLAKCDTLTPELELKWASIQPEPDRFDFAAMDNLAAFARANQRHLHGHTLLWHRSIPAWAKSAMAETRDWGIVHRYFATVIERYGPLIEQWDVVNEPIDVIAGESLRRSPFFDIFGPGYIRRALESARALAPKAMLLINEFGMDYPDQRDEDRRRSLIGLIDSLKAQGVAFDGVGLQCHLDLRRGPFDQRIFAAFLGQLAERGMAVFITELDVREADRSLPVAQRDRRVADLAGALVDVALDQPAVRGITCWGLSDRYSWLNAEGSDRPRPGLNRGLPLDRALRPKALHDAIANAFLRHRTSPDRR